MPFRKILNLKLYIMKNLFLFMTILLFSLTACQKENEILDNRSSNFTTLEDEEVRVRQAPHPRPFKGTVFEGFSGVDIDCACEDDDLVFGSAGTGNLTHMGKVTSTSTVCIDAFLFDENGEIIGSVVNTVCTKLIAANGDELMLEGSPHTLPPGILTVTFVGGTGKFENASGSADLVVSFDGSTYTEVYDGVIYY